MKTIVWTQPSRIFHWYLVAGFISAYCLSDYIQLHAAIGLSVGVLLLFRIIWGFMGPRYSRFRDFPVSFQKIKEFIKDIKEGERKYTGHNPPAAAVMLLIIMDGIGIAFSGLLTALSDENSFLGKVQLGNHETYKDVHELLVNLLIVLIILHLAGLSTSYWSNREAKVGISMFTGIKQMHGINANLTLAQKVTALLAATATLATFISILML